MQVVCISDVHNKISQVEIPDGDVLIVAGDLTAQGTHGELQTFAEECGALPHRHKLVVAGNHDFGIESDPTEIWRLFMTNGIDYLEDSHAIIDGVKFWGAPWVTNLPAWAFNRKVGPAIKAHWDKIPSDTDVLITHSPPWGTLDYIGNGVPVGCHDLAAAVDRIRPRFHVFGHIHESYGMLERRVTTSINASTCDKRYRAVNSPIVFSVSAIYNELPKKCELDPASVAPPGFTARRLMADFGMNEGSLGFRLGLTYDELDLFFAGEAPLTGELALKLENVFGISSEFWVKREKNYRESR